MIFCMSSDITGRIPKDSGVVMKTELYCLSTEGSQIENRSEEDANFELQVKSQDEEEIKFKIRQAKKRYEKEKHKAKMAKRKNKNG